MAFTKDELEFIVKHIITQLQKQWQDQWQEMWQWQEQFQKQWQDQWQKQVQDQDQDQAQKHIDTDLISNKNGNSKVEDSGNSYAVAFSESTSIAVAAVIILLISRGDIDSSTALKYLDSLLKQDSNKVNEIMQALGGMKKE